ncbi:MAG: Arm DNA-binding domain-containing protein, partial [Oscillospiraceae bacterium]|nr:Arm DNA-binding domain-containing protein [Oscillospiraceae bacterium]
MRKTIEKNIAYDDVKELYYVTFYFGVFEGKKKQETKTFTNKKDAKKALTTFEYNKANGLLALPDETTMEGLFERFIKSKETEECAVTTIGGYKRIWEHMSPIFKDVKVQDLTPLMVDNYFNTKREESKNK